MALATEGPIIHEQLPVMEMPTPIPADSPDEPEIEPSIVQDSPDKATEPTFLSPAPLAVPGTSENAKVPTPQPAAEQNASAEIVGDRYSNNSSTSDQPAPVEPFTPTPAASEAADDTDDIFGEPPTTDPSETPSATSQPEPVEPAAVEPPAEEPVSEGPVPEDSAPDESSSESEDDVEQIFGPTDSATDEPNEEEPAEKEEEPFDPFSINFQDISEQVSILSAAGGLRSDSDRTWTDNTAAFGCEARLVHVTAKSVVLLRSNGNQLTVPLARLSNADLHFVQQQIIALRLVRAQEATANKLAASWSH